MKAKEAIALEKLLKEKYPKVKSRYKCIPHMVQKAMQAASDGVISHEQRDSYLQYLHKVSVGA